MTSGKSNRTHLPAHKRFLPNKAARRRKIQHEILRGRELIALPRFKGKFASLAGKHGHPQNHAERKLAMLPRFKRDMPSNVRKYGCPPWYTREDFAIQFRFKGKFASLANKHGLAQCHLMGVQCSNSGADSSSISMIHKASELASSQSDLKEKRTPGRTARKYPKLLGFDKDGVPFAINNSKIEPIQDTGKERKLSNVKRLISQELKAVEDLAIAYSYRDPSSHAVTKTWEWLEEETQEKLVALTLLAYRVHMSRRIVCNSKKLRQKAFSTMILPHLKLLVALYIRMKSSTSTVESWAAISKVVLERKAEMNSGTATATLFECAKDLNCETVPI